MKKILALTLLICILCPLTAAADVLAGDWKNATDDELNEARAAIIAELAERKNATLESAEVVTLSGSGTAIESIAVSSVPARVILNCTESAQAKITGGEDEVDINAYRTGYDQEVLAEAGEFSFMIQTEGNWTLTIEPIGTMGALTAISGNDSYVSDFFTLDKPVILHLQSAEASDINSYLVYLEFMNDYGEWRSTSLDIPRLSRGDALNNDIILEPVKGIDQYLIRVYSNLVIDWEFSAK